MKTLYVSGKREIEALGDLECKPFIGGRNQNFRGDYVECCINPKDKTCYLTGDISENELFIKGEGWMKTKRWEKVFIPTLPKDVSAEEMQVYAERYGDRLTQQMLGVDVDSYGGRYGFGGVLYYWSRKHYGRAFDEYMEKAKSLNDEFIQEALKKERMRIRRGNLGVYRKYSDGSSGFISVKKGNIIDNIQFCIGGRLSGLMGASAPNLDIFGLEKALRSLYVDHKENKFLSSSNMKAYKDHLLKIGAWIDNHSLFDLVAYFSNEEIARKVLDLVKMDIPAPKKTEKLTA